MRDVTIFDCLFDNWYRLPRWLIVRRHWKSFHAPGFAGPMYPNHLRQRGLPSATFVHRSKILAWPAYEPTKNRPILNDHTLVLCYCMGHSTHNSSSHVQNTWKAPKRTSASSQPCHHGISVTETPQALIRRRHATWLREGIQVRRANIVLGDHHFHELTKSFHANLCFVTCICCHRFHDDPNIASPKFCNSRNHAQLHPPKEKIQRLPFLVVYNLNARM